MSSLDEFAREEAILAELHARGRVVVTDLARRFQVSAVTVRKDLDALERRSMLRRVRGGAVSTEPLDEGGFEMRLRQRRGRKIAIARAAADLVQDGDVIALDSSTTCYFLAAEVLDRRNLVVVTNSLRVAMLLAEQSTATVLVPGGVLRRASGSLVGQVGEVLGGRDRLDRGFFGLVSASTSQGLLDSSAEEAQIKARLAGWSTEVYGLFDSSKVRGFGLHPFVGPDRITALFTDVDAPDEFVRGWADAGVPVRRVDPAVARPAGGRPSGPHRLAAAAGIR
ncbi:DeoR family transcriptional regulator [Nakamurella endophytica]|uniref:DeoR family transcriptional regulator n=2 Tax=Nakamurella endophytica TaxID=1748367 RepID=A0A917WDG4_9ACTN|nr:DeoR family transcriptional regulator [Nakamurella endophytica]